MSPDVDRPSDGRVEGRVVVIQPIHDHGLARLREVGLTVRSLTSSDPKIVAAELADAVAAITRSAGLSGDAMASAPKLRVIGNHGVGVDPIDLATARRLGIVVVNTPGANARSVAELTLTLMLATLKRLVEADGAVRRGDLGFKYRGGISELSGRTVGLIGFGAIGRQVAGMLHAAFDVRLLVHSRDPDPVDLAKVGARLVDLETLARESDVVSLHVPGSAETERLVNARFLGRMRRGAILVNTARGTLVDEDALVAALRSGSIAGAGLDVFRDDVPEPDHPLLALDHVVVTPHVGGATEEALERTAVAVATQVIDVLRDRRPAALVDPETWPQRRRGD